MQASEIMNKNPVCCTPDTPLQDVAEMMVEFDCGALPVVDNSETLKPLLGIVTDRDIVCRVLAEGKNPLEAFAKDCMSTPVATIDDDATVDEALKAMEENQVRRIPVIDSQGACVGIVTQAHIAKRAPSEAVGDYLRSISQRSGSASHVAR